MEYRQSAEMRRLNSWEIEHNGEMSGVGQQSYLFRSRSHEGAFALASMTSNDYKLSILVYKLYIRSYTRDALVYRSRLGPW